MMEKERREGMHAIRAKWKNYSGIQMHEDKGWSIITKPNKALQIMTVDLLNISVFRTPMPTGY